jgi:hypothetical protein
MQKIIPCEKCRKNFLKHLDLMEVEVLTSKNEFVKWLYNVHNLVNKDTGKPNFSYDDFINKYSDNNKNSTEQIQSVEYFDLVADNKKLENIIITLNQEIKTLKNKKTGIEHFGVTSNTFIIGLILLVILIIVVVNRC